MTAHSPVQLLTFYPSDGFARNIRIPSKIQKSAQATSDHADLECTTGPS